MLIFLTIFRTFVTSNYGERKSFEIIAYLVSDIANLISLVLFSVLTVNYLRSWPAKMQNQTLSLALPLWIFQVLMIFLFLFLFFSLMGFRKRQYRWVHVSISSVWTLHSEAALVIIFIEKNL